MSVQRKRLTPCKHWCFTINNPTDDDAIDGDNPIFTYLVAGRETSESGTPHIQGYVCFKKRVRRTAVAKLFPRAYLDQKRGTPLEASDYCKKDGDFMEFGILPKSPAQGAKASKIMRWEDAYSAAKDGRIEDIPADMRIQYYHAFKRIRQDNPPKLLDQDKTCGLWLVGQTGTGKSLYAREKYPDFYDKPLNKWWDGYQDQDNVIVDDLGLKEGEFLGTRLKRWTDHYPFPAEQKGTTIQIRPKQIIVTSQYTISDIFHSDPEMVDALERRFTVIEFPIKRLS